MSGTYLNYLKDSKSVLNARTLLEAFLAEIRYVLRYKSGAGAWEFVVTLVSTNFLNLNEAFRCMTCDFRYIVRQLHPYIYTDIHQRHYHNLWDTRKVHSSILFVVLCFLDYIKF